MNTSYILWVQEGKKKQVVYDFINHVGLDYMSKVRVILGHAKKLWDRDENTKKEIINILE